MERGGKQKRRKKPRLFTPRPRDGRSRIRVPPGSILHSRFADQLFLDLKVRKRDPSGMSWAEKPGKMDTVFFSGTEWVWSRIMGMFSISRAEIFSWIQKFHAFGKGGVSSQTHIKLKIIFFGMRKSARSWSFCIVPSIGRPSPLYVSWLCQENSKRGDRCQLKHRKYVLEQFMKTRNRNSTSLFKPFESGGGEGGGSFHQRVQGLGFCFSADVLSAWGWWGRLSGMFSLNCGEKNGNRKETGGGRDLEWQSSCKHD